MIDAAETPPHNAPAASMFPACQWPPRRLRAMVHRALRQSGYPAVAAVHCEIHSSGIVLSGAVPSYYLKQVAQAVVLRLKIPLALDNRLVVPADARRRCS